VGETSGGQIRSGRQMTLITPQRLSRFGIEVDEALGGVPDFWESPMPEKPILLASSTSFRALGPKIRISAPCDPVINLF